METRLKRICIKKNPSYAVHYTEGIMHKNDSSVGFHYDPDFAILYMKKGKGMLRIEGNHFPVSDGDIVVTTPNQIHRYEMEDGVYQQKVILYVNPSILSGFCANGDEFFECFTACERGGGNVIPSDTARQYKLDALLEDLLSLAKDESKRSELLCLCRIVEILSAVCDAYDKKADAPPTVPPQNRTVARVIDFLNENLSEDINIEKIASEFYMSKSRLSHLFKEATGVSIWDYIILLRLIRCNEYIKNGDAVKEAAYKSGFNNYSNFYRLYKKHIKMTPSEYKERVARG
jgi:AraC-like DNA-binding protein